MRPQLVPCYKHKELRRGGFTLTELLIVIGIIVLMIGLAVPLLGVLTGNRSVDGAQNIIQSYLNDARMQAIGQQRDTGVLFFVSPISGRVNMAMVQASDAQSYDPVYTN